MVDKTEVASMSNLIEAKDVKMKSVCSVKFVESLNSMHIYSHCFVKWWHLSKIGAKISVDERCLRCGGVIRINVKKI